MQAGHVHSGLGPDRHPRRRRGAVSVATMLAIPLLLTLLVGVVEMTRLLAGMSSMHESTKEHSRVATSADGPSASEFRLARGEP